MAVATWHEWNTSTAYATPDSPAAPTGISNTNWGNANSLNINTTTNPITAGTFGYQKKHAIKFTSITSPAQTVDDLRFFAFAGLHATNGTVTTCTPANNDCLFYADLLNQTNSVIPSNSTSINAHFTVTSVAVQGTLPGAFNLSTKNAAGNNPIVGPGDEGQGSNYFVHQLSTGTTTPGTGAATTTAGPTTAVELRIQYRVIG